MSDELSFTRRVIRKADDDGTFSFGIHELHYDQLGMMRAYTVEPLLGPFASEELLLAVLGVLRHETHEKLSYIGSNPEEIEKWIDAAQEEVILFERLPAGKRIISSPTPDPDDPLVIEMVYIDKDQESAS